VAIEIGSRAPDVEGIEADGARALVFYKVTCGVTKMAGPALATLGAAYPSSVVGVGQDPAADLAAFADAHAWTFPQVVDAPPYSASDAYGVTSAPTVIVVDDGGRVADVVESWDRVGMNRASATLAALLGVEAVELSSPRDGLPAFKPG